MDAAKNIEITDEQQRVKVEIMDKVMKGIFETLNKNLTIYDRPEQVLDAIFSVLVMTSRDVLSHLIISTKNEVHVKRLLKEFFKAVTDEVEKKIRVTQKESN